MAGTAPHSHEPDQHEDSSVGHLPRIIWISRVAWLVVSAGFLAYLAFGSVEARIWSYGRLYFQDRRIAHVWAYFGDYLPDLPADPLTAILYYVSLAVMVLGTILGLWYFLSDAGGQDAIDMTSAPEPVSTRSTPSLDG